MARGSRISSIWSRESSRWSARRAIGRRGNRGDELRAQRPQLAAQQRAHLGDRLGASVQPVVDRVEVDALRVAPVTDRWRGRASSTHSRCRRGDRARN